MSQIVLRTKEAAINHFKGPGCAMPCKIVGVQNLTLNRPYVAFPGVADDFNQGCGLSFENCAGIQIICPTVYCVAPISSTTGGRGYGIVADSCLDFVVRGGGHFDSCHSAMMSCNGSRNVQFGDTDNDITLMGCWMTDVHGSDSQARFYRIKGGRIHIGNITPSLLQSGTTGCVVQGCNVSAIEVAGRTVNAKVYQNVAREYRLYPSSGLPFQLDLQNVGDAVVTTQMLDPKTGKVVVE